MIKPVKIAGTASELLSPEPLSVLYFLLQADQKIAAPRELYVRMITPTDTLTETFNSQTRKVKEFLVPGLVGLDNPNGKQFNTIRTPTGQIIKQKTTISSFAFNRDGFLKIAEFGQDQKVKSSILTLVNTLWELEFWGSSRANRFQLELEVFLGPKLFSAKESEFPDNEGRFLPELTIKGTGMDPDNTFIRFEPKPSIKKEPERKAYLVKTEIINGIEEQTFIVDIPNEAMVGGWLEAYSQKIPSNRLLDVVYSCYMLDDSANFETNAVRRCK